LNERKAFRNDIAEKQMTRAPIFALKGKTENDTLKKMSLVNSKPSGSLFSKGKGKL